MNVKIENVTPELAKSWLEQANNFRQPNRKSVSRMASDMREGKWEENGESIKFNEKDELVDGQHRLMACIESGKAFKSVVVYDVRSDLNIDVGVPRKLWQYLKQHGVEHYAYEVAAALRLLMVYRRTGSIQMVGKIGGSTNSELMALFAKESAIVEAVRRIQNQKKMGLSSSIASVLFHIFSEKDKELAEKFVQGLEGSIVLPAADPVTQLRQRLAENKVAKFKMTDKMKAALAILAWNYWRNNQGCRNLQWREVGPTAMDFPAIV